jgi:hypothetical protein
LLFHSLTGVSHSGVACSTNYETLLLIENVTEVLQEETKKRGALATVTVTWRAWGVCVHLQHTSEHSVQTGLVLV